MGMLDRYKKKGGFVQLLNLLETSGKQKQEQFLTLIAQENKQWEETLRKKMLTLDRILGWESNFRSEIFTRVQPLTLSTVLHDLPQGQVDMILSCLSMGEKRKILGMIGERNPTAAEKASCVLKVVSETRGFCMTGVVKLEKADPEMAIAENIEEVLGQDGEGSIVLTNAPELVFPEENPKPRSSEPKAELAHTRHANEEAETLKKKVAHLTSENNTLKHELAVVRNKLEQIKKIA